MRFERLIAEKYGKFDDFDLPLPAPEQGRPDLHLVVGLNEAGKSTLRQGILELLYGFPTQGHAMAYRHGRDTLIAADISDGAEAAHWRRTRGRGSPLLDSAGTQVPAAALAKFLGATSEEEFRAMYCLDHEGLRSGSKSILKGDSELGKLLFEAATGLRQLGAVQKQIDEACNVLIADHGRANSRLKTLTAEAKAAEDKRKAAEIKAPDYRNRVETLANAQTSLNDARKDLADAKDEEARLDRNKMRLPLLAVYQDRETKLNEVRAGPDLPADALALLGKYETDTADQARLLQEAKNHLEACAATLASCKERDAILDLEAEIEAIADSAGARSDQEDLGEELKTVKIKAATLASSLGYTEMTTEQLRAAVPSYATRTALQQSLNQLNTATANEATQKKSYEDAEAEVEEANRDLNDNPAATVSKELSAVLDAAAAVPPTADVETADRQAKTALANALTGLSPWTGDEQQLRALVPPTNEVMADWEQRETQLAGQLNTVNETLRQTKARRSVAAGNLRELPDAAVTGNLLVLQSERSARDAAWGSIKSGATSVSSGAAELEQHTEASDGEADALIRHATQAAQRATLQQQIDAHDLDIAEADQAKQVIDTAIADLGQEITAACKQLGLPEQARPALRDWLARRIAALLKGDEAGTKAAALESRKEQISDERNTVVVALTAAGLDAASLAELNLKALIILGKDLIETQRTKQEAHRAAKQNADSAKASLDKARPLYTRATETAKAARETWDSDLGEAKLPAQITDANLMMLLERFNDLETKLTEIQTIDRRLKEIADFLKTTEQQWSTLAAKAAIPAEGLTPAQVETAVRSRLKLAEAEEVSRRDATTARDNAATAQTKAAASAQRVEESIKPLLTQAGTEDIAEAKLRAGYSDSRRECRNDLKAAREALLLAVAGRTLDQIRIDLVGQTLQQVEDQLRKLKEGLPDLETKRDAAQTAAEAAQRALDEVTGSGAAAEASTDRKQIHAQMAEVVRQYLRLKAAGAVIRRALQIYRNEKQGPVVRLASGYFRDLTNGAFERLDIDDEGDSDNIAGIRANTSTEARRVSLEGMSDGTRDQLYLALRLAGVDLQIHQNQRRVPVICDDLFVHFDDERATAAFKALAELGKSTQVIYFSHHPHLENLALRAHAGWKVHQLSPT